MNTNLRALVFGAAVAAVLTVTMNSVTAAETLQVVRLDGVSVTANTQNFDAEGNLKVTRLEGVTVTAHRAAI